MKLCVIKGDITKIETDAIVNAANSSLLGGGGVDGAIHRAGGPEILEACRKIAGGCPTGEAVMTTAGKLPAKKVIHTVGPVWKGGDQGEGDLLRSCYERCLELAEEEKLHSVAFPNISTGVYGFPKREAAEIAISTVKNFRSELIDEVYFVCYDQENYEIYQELM